MAKVYLPLGYPQISGQQFENVIYSGNLVRCYTGVNDPRTDAQLQERRFLSDVTKVRSMLGPLGRGACRSVLGNKWGTVIYQAIKSDMDSMWSTARADWLGFTENDQDAWRVACPYRATFNDLGEMFYCVAWVVSHLIDKFGGMWFGVGEWGAGDSSAALDWWTRGVEGLPTVGQYFYDNAIFAFGGNWTDEDGNPTVPRHVYISQGAGGEFFEFDFFGRKFDYYYFQFLEGGACDFYLDGQLVSSHSQYKSGSAISLWSSFDALKRGVHHARFVGSGGKIVLDNVAIQS